MPVVVWDRETKQIVTRPPGGDPRFPEDERTNAEADVDRQR